MSYNGGGGPGGGRRPYNNRYSSANGGSSYSSGGSSNYVDRSDRDRDRGGYRKSYNNNGGGYYNNQQHDSYRRPQSSAGGERSFHRNSPARASPSPSTSTSESGTTQHQVWMGDLDSKWDSNAITEIWKKMGESPINVKILRSDPYKPPYCFVTFNTHQQVSSAMQKNGMQIPGSSKVFKLNWASGTTPANASSNGERKPQNYNDQLSVFVGDLNSEITESKLYEAFNGKYPNQVKQVKIMIDVNTGESKGFGFIRFATVQIQQRAIREMNGAIVKGGGIKPIKVSPAAKDQETPSSAKAINEMDSAEATAATNAALLSLIPLSQTQPTLNQYTDPFNTTIRIKGLSGRMSEIDLKSIFIAFGNIIYCKLSKDYESGYIQYLHRTSAELAILSLQGTEIDGCRLLVNWGASIANTEQNNINYSPSISNSKVYKKLTTPPKVYGVLNRKKNIVFESIESSLLEVTELSEPLSISKINNEYAREKLDRDVLFQ